MKKRTAIFISGRGSNMKALIEAARATDFPAEIALVFSNKLDAPGLAFATEQGIPTRAMAHQHYPNREAFDTAVDAVLREYAIEMVCLAGYMRLFSASFANRWEGRVLNIHPALLPSFKGAHPHEDAIAAGVRVSGCTVHFVTAEMDAGAIIAQTPVPVEPSDTPETLAARVLIEEHKLYPEALRQLASGKVALRDGKAVFV